MAEANGNGATGEKSGSDVANGNGASGYVNPGVVRPIWETANGEGTGENGNRSSEPAAPEKRGRGRPKGSGTKQSATTGKTEAAVSVSVSSLEKLLHTIHATLALGVGRMELQLDDDEAKQLAKALLEVQAQYKIILDPRTAAWMNLMMVAAPIYGSRAVAIWMERLRNEPAQQTEPQPATVETTAKEAPKSNTIFDVGGFKFDPNNIKLHS